MTVSLNEEVTYNGNTSSSITFSDPSQWTVSNYHPDCDRTGVWFADLNGDGLSASPQAEGFPTDALTQGRLTTSAWTVREMSMSESIAAAVSR